MSETIYLLCWWLPISPQIMVSFMRIRLILLINNDRPKASMTSLFRSNSPSTFIASSEPSGSGSPVYLKRDREAGSSGRLPELGNTDQPLPPFPASSIAVSYNASRHSFSKTSQNTSPTEPQHRSTFTSEPSSVRQAGHPSSPSTARGDIDSNRDSDRNIARHSGSNDRRTARESDRSGQSTRSSGADPSSSSIIAISARDAITLEDLVDPVLGSDGLSRGRTCRPPKEQHLMILNRPVHDRWSLIDNKQDITKNITM